VLVCDPHVERLQASRLGVEAADLATVLVESDFVSLHVPLTALTRGLIGARELALMKRTAYLINTSRGAVVDEEALAASLVSGRLGGAGLDVFEHEPLPLSSPLRGLDTVVLSDHAAWYSEESVAELKTKAARNVAAVLAGRAPAYPLNIPAGHEVSGSDGEAAGSLALGSGSPHDER
jgi:D-3-phosphoglycerate dehydrogenase